MKAKTQKKCQPVHALDPADAVGKRDQRVKTRLDHGSGGLKHLE